MRFEFFRILHAFTVQTMFLVRFNNHGNCFIHFVGYNTTSINFTLVTVSHVLKPPYDSFLSKFSFSNDCFHTGNCFTNLTNTCGVF
ncbi:30S ribosomal protein S17 [Listeria monocytogenes]|nr:30S ribosomal protein S17 [Listeria monocytogenes]GAT39625.1 30S ribosomal protein S17 [Listeria monocytogenes]